MRILVVFSSNRNHNIFEEFVQKVQFAPDNCLNPTRDFFAGYIIKLHREIKNNFIHMFGDFTVDITFNNRLYRPVCLRTIN
jgi:hypothetical protein